MKTKKINVGNVKGLSTYQLAVLSGKFTGSLEDFLNKEQKYYNDTVEYADKAVAKIEELLANIVDSESSGDLAEIINARGQYRLLGDRLSATDDQLEIILQKIRALDPSEVKVDAITLFGSNKNIELRNNGVAIQWRRVGDTEWITLMTLDDMTPNIQIGTVGMTSDETKVRASISGTRKNPLLNLVLPKGKDGIDGGSIVSMRINEKGEGIVTVVNEDLEDLTSEDQDGNRYLVPVITIGEVTTLEYDQPATASISGTITNPKLNLGIPKGKPCVIKRAKVGEDGWLEFEFE